jgi:hypothetical protein
MHVGMQLQAFSDLPCALRGVASRSRCLHPTRKHGRLCYEGNRAAVTTVSTSALFAATCFVLAVTNFMLTTAVVFGPNAFRAGKKKDYDDDDDDDDDDDSDGPSDGDDGDVDDDAADMPYPDRDLYRCLHQRVSRTGSNRYVSRGVCRDCGAVLWHYRR